MVMEDKETKMQERAEPRKSRAEDQKRLEERIAQFKDFQFGVEVNMLDKVKGLAPDGWTYGWILSSIYNEPNNMLHEKCMQGWSVVPPERHPTLYFNDSVDGRRAPNGTIEYKGVTLCEIPTILYEKEQAALHQKAMRHANAIPDADRYMGDPHAHARFRANPELTRTPQRLINNWVNG